MIEYRTRRRESDPKRGDRVWIEGKIPDKPLAIGSNGFIARIDWQEREAVIVLDGKQLTMELSELRNCWNDVLGSYIVEEPYVQGKSIRNDSDTPSDDGEE
jgi:hypothetical protein